MKRWLSFSAFVTPLLFLYSCMPPGVNQVVVHFENSEGDSGGKVILCDKDGGTSYQAKLKGLEASTSYDLLLLGGTCETPGASVTKVAMITTDDHGHGSSGGSVLFRDKEAVELGSITDAQHILVLRSAKDTMCAAIPVLATE